MIKGEKSHYIVWVYLSLVWVNSSLDVRRNTVLVAVACAIFWTVSQENKRFVSHTQGRIHVWSESASPPPFWQINHANSAYLRLFLGYFEVISATPPPLLDLGPLFYISCIWPYTPSPIFSFCCCCCCQGKNWSQSGQKEIKRAKNLLVI